MFDTQFLGLSALFWQTIVIVTVAITMLVFSLRSAPTWMRITSITAAVVIFAPLAWANWWVTSGDPEPDPNAGSNIGSDLHYASLAIIVVLMGLFILAVRWWVSRHRTIDAKAPAAQS